jgi:hypothetical protein
MFWGATKKGDNEFVAAGAITLALGIIALIVYVLLGTPTITVV